MAVWIELRNQTFDISGQSQPISEGVLAWNSSFTILRSILAKSDADSLINMASRHTFDERPDSVDGQPAHELYALKDGDVEIPKLLDTMMPTLAILTRLVNLRVPVCRDSPSGCKACTSLIRRYRPGERRSHYEHTDGHAAATAVVSLSSAAEYAGGFFVSNLSSRALLPLPRGDAVVHASDLFHGVALQEGERWSWVVWLRTCPRCSLDDASTWYEQRATEGDPFAQFLHSRRLASSHRGAPQQRLSTAASWLNASALSGFAPAMHLLGQAYAAGDRGVPLDLRAAVAWLARCARESPSSPQASERVGGPTVGSRAAYDLARLLLRGDENGWPSPLPADDADTPSERARMLLERAAADGHERARTLLGNFAQERSRAACEENAVQST